VNAAHAVALDDDRALFAEVVCAVAERAVAPAAAALDAGAAVPASALNAVHEAGIPDLLADSVAIGASPEAVLLSALAVHHLAEASASIAVRVAAAHTAGAALLAGGDLAASQVAAAGGPGSLAVVDGRARLTVRRDRSELVLDGAVDPVVGACEARAFLVLVAPPDDEAQVLLIPADVPGAATDPGAERCGLKGAGGRVSFSQVTAGEAQRLGGAVAVRAAATHADLLLAAAAAGTATAAIAQAREYMLARRQFGKPIAEFGGLRDIVGTMAADADAAWALVEVAARQPEPWGGATAELAARAVAVATRTAVRVAVNALQMHGGYGYTTEFPVERLVRDAVSLRARASGGIRSRLADSADAVLGACSGATPADPTRPRSADALAERSTR
jgi:hypothetical protein